MSVIDTVRALIEKAAHENTPIDEARSAAYAACKLIKKHELLTNSAKQPSENTEYENPIDNLDDIPDFDSQKFIEVTLFKPQVAHKNVHCDFDSKHVVHRGLVYAQSCNDNRKACWDCRHKFT